jgi:alpha-glucosidase (family GH31 glycosyl hydrolase)
MVGSGQIGSFTGGAKVKDSELFVRWAQLSTFFPIIQYSMLPARQLTGEPLDLTMKMVDLRMKIAPEILELAKQAARTGEPILRHMCYEFPDEDMQTVQDQYMLGGKYLVAPVVTQGARSRIVKFPRGTWHGEDGSVVKGPCEIEVSAPLSRLPYYVRKLGTGPSL